MDGFPINRENWTAMIEQELLPDSVIALTDEDAPADYLLSRYTKQQGLLDPSTFKIKKQSEAGDEVYMYVHVPLTIIICVVGPNNCYAALLLAKCCKFTIAKRMNILTLTHYRAASAAFTDKNYPRTP